MNQSDLIAKIVQRPENYGWFLGAGASRNSGLPTANDLLLDLKCRYYCREENQDISRQDMQCDAVQNLIQNFMDSHGFPLAGSENEYTTYFEKIFGDDKERQRKYISAFLSEDKVTLSIGNRILGALLSQKLCRVIFGTNFDTVVEKSFAEMSGKSLSAYHLEGAHNAKNALANEEYPFYCKLHGDFRYDSIKNLSIDLEKQNEELATCFVNAGNRFGFVVMGYSGRDASVIELFHRVVNSENPFPHGLYWTGIKNSKPLAAVSNLLKCARQRGVDAQYVEIETFDTFMLRLWRNIDPKDKEMDSKVKKTRVYDVNIEMPHPTGQKIKQLVRMNALPILEIPKKCFSLSFHSSKEWKELRRISHLNKKRLIFTKADKIWYWGTQKQAKQVFGIDLHSIDTLTVPSNIQISKNLHVKGFIEEALSLALSRGKPLLSRVEKGVTYLIVDSKAENQESLNRLLPIVGKSSGIIPGLFSTATLHEPTPQQVSWAEALRLSVEYKNDLLWLVIDPEIWIWPSHARSKARKFLEDRRSKRYNKEYNDLLSAWIKIILNTNAIDTEITVSSFAEGDELENPSFRLSSRTAFSRKLSI